MQDFEVIIEIPAHSAPVKYEMDKVSARLVVDRFVVTGMQYPANYGFIPNTMSEDGDPLDVLVVTPWPLIHSCSIMCRSIGLLNMEDESGIDTKIIACPTRKVCPMYAHIDELKDLPEYLLEQIKFFFENYKKLEPNKWVKVTDFADKAQADKLIGKSFT
jgi:inorganic pyrophosphatase